MGHQLLYILALALVGALMGTVFDLYNTVTGTTKWFRWLRPLLDIAFWIVSALAVYYVALKMDSGRLRVYSFILLFVGYVVYRLLFHATVVASAFRIVRFTQGVLRAIARVLGVLVWRPLRFILGLAADALKGLYVVGCKIETGLFAVLRFVMHRIVWRWMTYIPGIERSFHYMDKLWKDFWDQASKWMRARIIRS